MRKIRYKEPRAAFENIAPPFTKEKQEVNYVRDNSVREIFQISVENILPYHGQPRTIFDTQELENLAESIKELGITSPLLISKSIDHGKFHVINGERRLRAAKLIGIKKVPCIIVEDEEKNKLIAIVDNIQRADLHPVELASAYQSLIKSYGDKKKVSEKLGLPYTSFLESLRINELPEEIKIFLLNNNISSRDMFRKLLKLSDIKIMRQLLGMEKEHKERGQKLKRKKLVDIFTYNQKVSFQINKNSIKVEQKEELLKTLEYVIKQVREL